MSLSGEELKNDGLVHNKHLINGRILLGCVLEGRVVQWQEIFIFSTLLTSSDQIYPPNQISNPLIQFILIAPPPSIIKNGLNVKDYWWFWEKKKKEFP